MVVADVIPNPPATRLVREARDGGATVFFSSHVLAEVQSIADRVAIIRAGEIVEHGSTAQLTGGGLVRVSVRLAMGARLASPELDALPGVRVEARLRGGINE